MTCPKCGGLIGQNGVTYGYAGPWCSCPPEPQVLTPQFAFVKFPKSTPKKKKTMYDYAKNMAKKRSLTPRPAKKKKVKPSARKIKQIPYKTLFNKAVKVFQKWIRERDKCCVIGRDIDFERKRCGGYLTCGHFISRTRKKVIFNEINSNGQCQNHNGLHRFDQGPYTVWLLKKYGTGIHEQLVEESRVNAYKWSREQLEEIIKKYGKSI